MRTGIDGELRWVPTWGQAVTDFRGEDDEPGFDDVTVRMAVPASIGGDRVRVELSNRFGDAPVRIGHVAVGAGGSFVDASFAEGGSTEIPVGESRWSDPIDLAVEHGDEIVVDVYLPEATPYATAAGFRFGRSPAGDFAGAAVLPTAGPATVDPEPDGSGWSLPAGGPFLRTVEVAGVEPEAVVVAFGGSSTAMGWPQYGAESLPADARIAIVNRGIPGNRIRLDAPPATPSWGRAGLARFDDDVLGTEGASHLVIAYNSNDWGLPGRATPIEEMPTIEQLIAGYQELVDRAEGAGLTVILATVTPLAPELRTDPVREGLRLALNDWIRSASGRTCVDFDEAIRSDTDPACLRAEYAAPDDTHPSIDGSKRLARAMVEVLPRLGLTVGGP